MIAEALKLMWQLGVVLAVVLGGGIAGGLLVRWLDDFFGDGTPPFSP